MRAAIFERFEGPLEVKEVPEPICPADGVLVQVEDGRVTPLGASQAVTVDVRIVAATNSDLFAGPEGFRSDLLRRQLRRWTDEVAAAGKAAELFELELWLRSFERFFRIGGQPLSEQETRSLGLRSWSEELRLVDHTGLSITELLTSRGVGIGRFCRLSDRSRHLPLHFVTPSLHPRDDDIAA